jgi:hypothetical protein
VLSTDPPLANPEDMAIPQCVPGADEAIVLIRAHHAQRLDPTALGKESSP